MSGSGSSKLVGVLLGALALGGAAFAGWTLYSLGGGSGSPGGSQQSQSDPGGAGVTDPGVASMETVQAVLASVQQLIKDENHSAAQRVLSEAVRKFPDDQDLRLAFGDFLMTRQQWGDAYDQYASAIAAGPVPAGSYFAAGTLASMTQRPELAAEHYAQAMRADPQRPEYPLYLASMQMRLNRLREAKASLAIAGRLAPDRAEVWGMYAQIALDENKLTIAQQQVERARGLEPRESAWLLMEARIQKRMGDPERAMELLSVLSQAQMDDPGTLGLLAECYGMLGRPGEAASRYMDAAERDPGNAELAFEAALWLDRLGERDEAIAWARRALERGSERAGAWIDARAED